MSKDGIQFEGARGYRGCSFCGGRGCLACAQQSKRDQQAAFENPLYSGNPNDPEDAKRLQAVMQQLLGPGWQQRGIMVAVDEPVKASPAAKLVVYDGDCPLASCNELDMHSHPVCLDCGAVQFQNLACVTCRQEMRKGTPGKYTMVATLDALGIETVVPVSSLPALLSGEDFKEEPDAL